MFELDRYFAVTNTENDRTRIEYACSLLKDSALVWLQSYEKDTPTFAQDLMWAEFKTVLKEQFMPMEAEDIARQELMVLNQGPRSVEKYVEKFRSLEQRVPSMDEATKRQIFRNGLKFEIQQHMLPALMDKNRKVEELMLQAHAIEAALSQQQNQRNKNNYSNRQGFGKRAGQYRTYNNYRGGNSHGYHQQPSNSSGHTSSVPMELGATRSNANADTSNNYDSEDTHDIAAVLDEISAVGDEIDEDTEYQLVAAVMNNRKNTPNPEYKPRWHKIIPGLTASDEIKLYREKKCYICRGGGHRLLACPKLRDGAFTKRDRINNVEAAESDEDSDEYESKNGYGQ